MVQLGTWMMGRMCAECKCCVKHTYQVPKNRYNHSVAVSGKCIHGWAYIGRYYYNWRPDNTLGRIIKIQGTRSSIYILGAVTKLKNVFFFSHSSIFNNYDGHIMPLIVQYTRKIVTALFKSSTKMISGTLLIAKVILNRAARTMFFICALTTCSWLPLVMIWC